VQDTIETLRHETFVHFGINLLAPSDKTALLADIIAAKGNPFIGNLFKQIIKTYPEIANNAPPQWLK
jgi:hypothetical protein